MFCVPGKSCSNPLRSLDGAFLQGFHTIFAEDIVLGVRVNILKIYVTDL